jgi:hypothetical protein
MVERVSTPFHTRNICIKQAFSQLYPNIETTPHGAAQGLRGVRERLRLIAQAAPAETQNGASGSGGATA